MNGNPYLKSDKRARRRFHTSRLRKKRRYYWGMKDSPQENWQRVVNTPKLCSCPLCGNARKHWKEDRIQEKRFSMASEWQAYISEQLEY